VLAAFVTPLRSDYPTARRTAFGMVRLKTKGTGTMAGPLNHSSSL
jgi:hypothetical protein